MTRSATVGADERERLQRVRRRLVQVGDMTADEVEVKDERDEASRERKWPIPQFFAELTFGAVVVGVVALWLLRAGDCAQAVIDTQIAGDTQRFATRFASTYPSCTDDQLGGALARNLVVVVVYSGTAALLLNRWWNDAWDSELGEKKMKGWWFAVIAAIAVALSAVGNLITGLTLDITNGIATLEAASIIAAIGWGKWLLVSLLGSAVVAMTLSWCVRGVSALYRQVRDSSDAAKYVPTSCPWVAEEQRGYQGFGIALSGGGIRSAAFSLGALSALEDTELRPGPQPEALLDQAQLLATVSGGGYTGTAWRIAAGDGERERDLDGDYRRVIGDPNRLVPYGANRLKTKEADEAEPPLLADRLRDRRSFLRNGRGGMAFSIVRLVAQLVFHVGLLLWTVGLVAWLIGRFIGTWAITTPGVGIEYGRLIRPATYALIAFAVFAGARMFTVPGWWRKVWDGLAGFCGAVAAGLALGLVVVPWAVVELLDAIAQILPGGTGAQSSVALVLTSGIAASAWRVLQAPLRSRAPYLGGVLLALSLLLFAMVVAGEAADAPSSLFFFPDQWWTWSLFWLAPFVAMLSVLNPDLWSLHPIYARLLRGTFENRLVGNEWQSFSRGEWPSLSGYERAKGPHPIICTAAARENRSNTGLSVVSMTFEPDYVTLHKGAIDGEDCNSIAIKTSEYEDIFSGRTGERRLRSIIGMAALSAAAVAPSLGRSSMGSTDGLFAALNLRLGAWLPNPDYDPGKRRIGPHMINMFKELTGRFGLEEPNLYVTDGGHWENIALVELLRRKPAVVIAVDSSLDEPYSLTMLLEAKELARVECGAVISFDPESLAQMRPSDSVRPPKNWSIATIEYAMGPGESEPMSGRMLFVKAQASDALPLDILRYSKEDPNFPNYSTADQLLSDREFSHLAVLGRESMISALEDKMKWLFDEYKPLQGAFGPPLPEMPMAAAGPIIDATDPIDLADEETHVAVGVSLPQKRATPTGATL